MKGILSFIWEIGKIVFIALLIVIPVRYFLFQPFIVKGASMEPNFQHGDYLIVDQISYRFREPQRGEVVVFRRPEDFGRRYIKRIIGLPGERIEIRNGQVVIFDQQKQKEKVLDETDFLLLGHSDGGRRDLSLRPNAQTYGDVGTYLAEDEFFVLGDNRIASSDSRHWGALSRENIIGRVSLRLWPFNNLTIFETPTF